MKVTTVLGCNCVHIQEKRTFLEIFMRVTPKS